MKLQGKKTGTVAGFIGYLDDTTTIDLPSGGYTLTVRYKEAGTNCYKDYKTIAEFTADWEDYKPVEPLIKDEKIRKAVRAWAEANEFDVLHIYGLCGFEGALGVTISFTQPFTKDLKAGWNYTIEELCGEENEGTYE